MEPKTQSPEGDTDRAARARTAGRRVALLRRAGMFSEDLQGAEITRATSLEDFEAAYRLTHDVFVRQGYIHPDPSGIRIRPYEALPETATFVAKHEGQVVGVTTVVVDTPEFGLPTDHCFRDEVDALRAQGKRICEGTNWLVADSHRNSAVMTELMRCSFAHAKEIGCTDYLGTVSPGHSKFYQLLEFQQIGAVRNYSDEIEDPVVLVRMDIAGLPDFLASVPAGADEALDFLKGYYIDRNPYHQRIAAWQIQSERFWGDPLLLNLLFVHDSDFLPRCDAATLDALRGYWGDEVFQKVHQAQAWPVL